MVSHKNPFFIFIDVSFGSILDELQKIYKGSGLEVKKKCLKIENWERYQARTDKNMPWLKLWGSLFDRYWWQTMPDADKIIPVVLLDMARKFNNQIPFDMDFLRRNYGLKHTEEELLNICNSLKIKGFLSDCIVRQKSDVRASSLISSSLISKNLNKKNQTNELPGTEKARNSEKARGHEIAKRRELGDREKWFEGLWAKYPNKDGKKHAKRHFLASVKTQEDYARISKALENYLGSKRVREGFIKNGSTWFNNWQDWLEYQEPNLPEKLSKTEKIKRELEEIDYDQGRISEGRSFIS